MKKTLFITLILALVVILWPTLPVDPAEGDAV